MSSAASIMRTLASEAAGTEVVAFLANVRSSNGKERLIEQRARLSSKSLASVSSRQCPGATPRPERHAARISGKETLCSSCTRFIEEAPRYSHPWGEKKRHCLHSAPGPSKSVTSVLCISGKCTMSELVSYGKPAALAWPAREFIRAGRLLRRSIRSVRRGDRRGRSVVGRVLTLGAEPRFVGLELRLLIRC